MKKLYFGFILLFGFLAFGAQIALADLIIDPMFKGKKKEQKDTNENTENNNEYECILNKKKKLSQKYKGTNLTMKLDNIDFSTSQYVQLGEHYFIDLKTFNKETCDNGRPWKDNFEQDLKKYERGFYINCREYIKFNKKQGESFGESTTFFVDVPMFLQTVT